jgi:hypothetical protein
MLITEPGAPEGGYQALAIVEALIDVLSEQGTIIPADRARIIKLAVQKLRKAGGSVRQNSARLISDRIARGQEFK